MYFQNEVFPNYDMVVHKHFNRMPGSEYHVPTLAQGKHDLMGIYALHLNVTAWPQINLEIVHSCLGMNALNSNISLKT